MSYSFSASVTLFAVLLYSLTAFAVGWARWRYGIKAPAMVGHPMFERAVRVQSNTLEQMPIFLPSLWLAAICHGDTPAAAIGLGFVAFRILYTVLYLRSPERRGYGYVGGTICLVALWTLAVWGVGEGYVASA